MTADHKETRASHGADSSEPSRSTFSPRPQRRSTLKNHVESQDGAGVASRLAANTTPRPVSQRFPVRLEEHASRSADATGHAPPPPGWADTDVVPGSPGYYSLTSEVLGEVAIPPAPRVPDLDLDAEPAPDSERDTPAAPMDVFEMEGLGTLEPRSSRFAAEETPVTMRTPPHTPSWLPENEGEFAQDEAPPFRRYESVFPVEERVRRARSSSRPPAVRAPFESDSSSKPPTRLYFSPHVRQQADEWAKTGSLSLPGCSSPRHARAVQRALLLALLTEPGWHELPVGLRQRAGWLFCIDWEISASQGHPHREVDDLATVLSMAASEESREVLRAAVAAVVPVSAARASRPPPRRRSSHPPRRTY